MMLGFEDKLVDNLEKFRFIENHEADEDYTEDEFFKVLSERVKSCMAIFNENRAITDNLLRPKLNNPSNLSPQEVDSFFELAFRLYSFQKPLDMGLSLEILISIVSWSRKHRDTDRLIKSLYHTGYIYQQMNDRLRQYGSFAFYDKCHECFTEAASYIDIYFEIADKETRRYINRCLGNLYVISYNRELTDSAELKAGITRFLEKVNVALDFWNNEKVRAFDPDMPWDFYIMNAHQNTSNWVWAISRVKYNFDDMMLIRRVSESCKFLLELDKAKLIGDFWTSHRTVYMEYAYRYCLDEISHEEMLENVRGMYLSADDSDYSLDSLYSNMSTPDDLIKLFSPDDLAKPAIRNEIKLIVHRMYEYCKNFPAAGNRVVFSGYVGTACKTMVDILDFDECVELILSLTIYTHMPTFVHSMVVQELSKIITAHIITTKPDYFAGTFGTKSAHDVIKNQQEIIELIGSAALCHDVGKILYLDKIAIFSRKLYDFEFEIIKEHSNAGNLIEEHNEKMRHITDIISSHHKWYDDSKGYGKNIAQKNAAYKSVINIVSAADSIDAATDGIGRYYSHALTLEEVINEINKQAGSRYCPVVSDALKDPMLVEKIRHCITIGRKKAYYKAYLRMKGKTR